MAETLQLIITADNKEALKAIEDLAKSTEGLKYKFQDVKKGTGEATNAMINFSRLAEDSAYGIRGAANNINPFIESFGRLREKAKESGTTIAQELLPTLIGPAGLAVAVSLVSALYIKWSDYQNKAKKEAEENAAANGKSADEIKRHKEAIDNIFSSVAKESTEVSTLVAVLNSENETRKRKGDALERLKKLNPEIFGDLRMEGNIVNGLNTAYNKYIENLENIIYIRTKQLELDKITTDILKKKGVIDSEEEKNIKNTGAALKARQDSLKGEDQQRRDNLNTQVKQNKEEAQLNSLYKDRDAILKALSERTKGIKISGADGGGGADKLSETARILKNLAEETKSLQYQLDEGMIKKLPTSDKDRDSYYSLKIKAISDAIKKLAGLTSGEATLALSTLKQQLSQTKVDEALELFEKKRKGYAAATTERALDPDRTARAFEMLDNEANAQFTKGRKKREDELRKTLKQQQSDYESFAKSIAGTLTNAFMGLWDAMERGQNVGESIAEIFKNIAKQLAEMVIQAVLFRAIMAAITGGTSEAGASTGLASIADFVMAGVQPHAAGGITTRPHIGLVGEAGPEAIMPLSKLSSFLNTTFNAGAMSGNSMSGTGQFVIKGNDLVLALQRSNYSLNLRRGI